MNSWTADHFWDYFNQLPEEIRQQAREAYRQFTRDPFAAGLNFKEVNAKRHLWSARVTKGYRAVGVRNGDTITWTWIGSHTEYDRRIKGKGK